MRSSAVAEELIARGKIVIFAGQISNVPWLAQRINTLGFSQILSSPESFISNPYTDVLILDSYIVPVRDVFIQTEKWKSVVVLADEFTPAYEAAIVIYPGLSSKWISTLNAKILAGPKFIPFRKSIQKVEKASLNKVILEILVIGGGTDSFNFTGAVCEVLRDTPGNFHASIFANNTSLSEFDSRLSVVPIGSDLDELAKSAGLVFTTASVTSLEFIAREVAVGIGCATDNQEEYYGSLSTFGVAVPIGRFVAGNWELDQAQITELIYSIDLRDALRSKCANLIDLDGASRIADEILKL
jgi:spore coat polysaccharide biosynthesis predicted glycosyltransferase SpsG